MSIHDQIAMCLYWRQRPMTGSQSTSAIVNYALRLSEAIPGTPDLRVNAHRFPNAPSWASLRREIADQVEAGYPAEWAYVSAETSSRSYAPQSTCKMGFSAYLSFECQSSSPALAVELCVGKADIRSPNIVILRIPHDIYDTTMIVGLVRASIEFWSPSYGTVTRPIYDDFLQQPIGEVRVGWLTYLARFSGEPRLLMPAATEKVLDGLLVFAQRDLPRIDDLEFVRKLKEVHEELNKAGVLNARRQALGEREQSLSRQEPGQPFRAHD